jgi:membrane fusion protein, copper/silver efflux system
MNDRTEQTTPGPESERPESERTESRNAWRERRTIAIVAIVALLLIGAGATAWLWRPWEISTTVHAHAEGEKYTCPMHPQVIQDGPGICPICFMDLVPVKAAVAKADVEHGLSPEAIALTERGRITADVATTTVSARAVGATIEAAAGVDYNEATHRVVTARFAGRIERLFVDETGQFVSRGAPLMEVYSPELVAAQQEYLVARETPQIELPTLDASSQEQGRRSGSQRLAQASRKRLELLGMTAAQIAALERRGEIAYSATVFAPASGIVLKRGVTEGAYVNVGTLIIEMVDLSSVYVIASVAESDAWKVRPGEAMSVTGAALGGETLHGSVDYVYPAVDAASRTVRVRGVFSNPGLRLKPGMYLSARILAPQKQALVVPADAVIRTGRRDIVYVEVAKNTYEPREIRLGARQGDFYELAGGPLNPGDRIVAEGGYLIDSETRLGATHAH